MVIRDGKWDIPNYFRDGRLVDLSLAYIVIAGSLGPPDTIDRAYPFIEQKRVAFGFPDILFGPDDAYRQLIEAQERTGAEVVLDLHSGFQPSRLGHGRLQNRWSRAGHCHEAGFDDLDLRLVLRGLDSDLLRLPASLPSRRRHPSQAGKAGKQGE